jgi:hypothetical protein
LQSDKAATGYLTFCARLSPQPANPTNNLARLLAVPGTLGIRSISTMNKEQTVSAPATESNFGSRMFLGIGVPKGATTWLYDLLATHPEAWLAKRIEVHFFDRESNFRHGLNWYRDLFPSLTDWKKYKALGDITPSYLYCSTARIEYIRDQLPGINKFICIVRNPIDRTYSHYNYIKRLGKLPADVQFDEFLQDHKGTVDQGLYSKHISRWLELYDREKFLILVFEEVFQDVEKAKQQICDFLNLDYSKFNTQAGTKKSNAQFSPKFPKTYAMAVRVMKLMNDYGLFPLVYRLKKLGINSLFSTRKKDEKSDPMSPATRQKLTAAFTDDVRTLEIILDRKISSGKDFE